MLFRKEQGWRWPSATCVGLSLLPVSFAQLCAPLPASSSALLSGLCELGSGQQAKVGKRVDLPGL